ncbi:polyphosphate kinase 2 family protein [Peptostreptococcus equinus]|uniref:Polyphosphate kinase 2 family protein n=1 Tax=Peptostreptococcus equinus TaxID=3003601 RepID=A0ABY7JPI3_9FIRM|nr:polyphosphate kinase 2 family protein [Peptostreptococcus sp. CBA3647]WAW14401.1 polyphosphate kinase 2 family protein [Peptostreptococcus sp. CBA3647]
MKIEKYKVSDGKDFSLDDFATNDKGGYKNKDEALSDMNKNIEKIESEQDKLYAQNQKSVLLIIQAMDAAGKDGLIKHVMTGLNPQGTQVFSFKQPSAEELDHDFLWRYNKSLPERGRIGIFNRSYYEDVLVVKVHNLIEVNQYPYNKVNDKFWYNRYEHIKNYEKYLYDNGIIPVKIFLNVSKDEQKERFMSRLNDSSKNWKFSIADVKERAYWNEYQKAYQDAISATASEIAPWYIIPADKKWFARLLVSEIFLHILKGMNLEYPQISKEESARLADAKKALEEEK